MIKKIAVYIVGILVFLTFTSIASAGTPTYSCDTCDYNSAKNIAKTKYKPISCSASNLNEGNPEFGETTYECNTTRNTIIVSNPIDERAWKFEVTATNQNPWTDAVQATISTRSLTNQEQQALSTFYTIDREFRDKVSGAQINTTSSYSNS